MTYLKIYYPRPKENTFVSGEIGSVGRIILDIRTYSHRWDINIEYNHIYYSVLCIQELQKLIMLEVSASWP